MKILSTIILLSLLFSCDMLGGNDSSKSGSGSDKGTEVTDKNKTEEEKEVVINYDADTGLVNQNIKPNHKSEAELKEDVVNYYNSYKTSHMKPTHGGVPGGFYLEADSSLYRPKDWTDNGQEPMTNSEATGYAMIIAAFMENREHFDGLYKYFDTFKSTNSNNDIFMSWIIPRSEDTTYRDGSATDGDLDIAYALLIAHDKWGSAGAVNYYEVAKKIIEAAERVLIADNNAIRFGDWCATSISNDFKNGTRSSDWLVDHFELFYKVTGNRVWIDVIHTIYNTIIPNVAHETTGLVPDFTTGDLTVPTGKILEDVNDKNYDWNACRYPWRQSVAFSQINDGETRKKIKANLVKIANFADGKIGESNNFSNIKSSYTLDGTTSTMGATPAFIAPMICSFTTDSYYQDELNAGWEYLKSAKVSYYHDSITLLSMIYISGLWQQPLSGRINALEGGGTSGGDTTPETNLVSSPTFAIDNWASGGNSGSINYSSKTLTVNTAGSTTNTHDLGTKTAFNVSPGSRYKLTYSVLSDEAVTKVNVYINDEEYREFSRVSEAISTTETTITHYFTIPADAAHNRAYLNIDAGQESKVAVTTFKNFVIVKE